MANAGWYPYGRQDWWVRGRAESSDVAGSAATFDVDADEQALADLDGVRTDLEVSD